jgi:hypothetical protein
MSTSLFSNSQIKLLQEFHLPRYYPPEELASLQQLLTSCIGNMTANKAIDELCSKTREDKIDPATQRFIRNLSYRTRHLDRIAPQLDTIFSSFESLKNGLDQEKISLENYGILYDLSALYDDMKPYYAMGLIESEELNKLFEYTEKSNKMMSYFEEKFNDQFKFPTGSVVVDDISKKDQLTGEKSSWLEAFYYFLLTNIITRFGHASKGISDQSSTVINKISHVDPNYEEKNFSLRNFLYSEIYHIKIEKLIDLPTQVLLEEHLGKDWLIQIEDKFGQIENELHCNAKDKYHSDKMVKFTSWVIFSVITAAIFGNKTKLTLHHSNEDIRDEVFLRGEWADKANKTHSNMLCSEFVGKTIIATIKELDDEIKKTLKEKGLSVIPDEIIKSPISRREKLESLTPERLIKAMNERGAIERVEEPFIVKKNISMDIKKSLIELKSSGKKMDEKCNENDMDVLPLHKC